MSSGNFPQLLTKSIIVGLEEDKSQDILIIRLYALTHFILSPFSYLYLFFFQTQSNTYLFRREQGSVYKSHKQTLYGKYDHCAIKAK